MSLAACGPRPDAKTVVDVFLSSRDVGDVDGAMTVVAPDVVMRAPNELQYQGAGQVRQWLAATLSDYSYKPSEAPRITAPNHVSWRDNLYSQDGARWVGEIEWQASIADLKITFLQGTVLRGASGIICPRCPPGTRI
ncbi:MAG TPA: hypothetical protein VK009_12715 [Chloroflexota bacterium]|nr:hypothetical protein [Chloroflexota bacterium]